MVRLYERAPPPFVELLAARLEAFVDTHIADNADAEVLVHLINDEAQRGSRSYADALLHVLRGPQGALL